MSAALSSCSAVLAVELVPEGAPTMLCLPLESAHLLGAAIGNDLARLLPGIETMGLAVAAALYDQAQILRPGWPIHRELMRMHQQAQRGGWMPAITSFGASAGHMATPVLEPDPRLIGSPLLLVPFTLVGHRHDVEQISALMERDFEEKGLADSATSLFLNEAFSIRSEHARYLTGNDLCALAAMQYEHVGFAPIWSIIECALLSPERDEHAVLDGGVQLHYRGGQLVMSGDAASSCYRQAAAILSAHGISATDPITSPN
ncbi:MAG: hypothetical protein IPF83_00530 [Rhodanobacteraceae bacterium]|nr:hypothetical protein [Rhodanobacteraceae bacterium]MBK7042908.1 hypothetical protein [Rhodanobacteraceae bacterium]MBP9153716.1 hypothetical protein [Xanthomonadales bacterium]HQW81093.1 hypothetical protein [Pseudomonadota bacterium]